MVSIICFQKSVSSAAINFRTLQALNLNAVLHVKQDAPSTLQITYPTRNECWKKEGSISGEHDRGTCYLFERIVLVLKITQKLQCIIIAACLKLQEDSELFWSVLRGIEQQLFHLYKCCIRGDATPSLNGRRQNSPAASRAQSTSLVLLKSYHLDWVEDQFICSTYHFDPIHCPSKLELIQARLWPPDLWNYLHINFKFCCRAHIITSITELAAEGSEERIVANKN